MSYINTDLNDFGRGNDLRESPKHLRDTMSEQLVERLRAEFDEHGNYVGFRELSAIVSEVLPTDHRHYSDAHAVGDGLEIDGLTLRADGRVVLSWKRGETKVQRGNFLSAGENEVLFIVLMCLLARGTNDDAGIVLLDEPDLHLANAAKRIFYQRIL